MGGSETRETVYGIPISNIQDYPRLFQDFSKTFQDFSKTKMNNLPFGYYYAAALALSADKDEIAALKGRLNGFFNAPQLRCAAEAKLAELEAPIIAAAKAKADIESDLMGLFS